LALALYGQGSPRRSQMAAGPDDKGADI